MNIRKPTIIACSLLIASAQLLSADPLRYQTPEMNEAAKELHEKLFGTVWTYTWRGNDFDFGFAKDGTITNFGTAWTDTKWHLVGARNVMIDSGGAVILLRFDDDATSFTATDWDDQPATGKPTGETVESRKDKKDE